MSISKNPVLTKVITPKERPILFKGEMVRAIQQGRRTQTRRIVKPTDKQYPAPLEMKPWVIDEELGQELDNSNNPCWDGTHPDYPTGSKWFSCPYGKTGDRLWVRETWACRYMDGIGFYPVYRADGEQDKSWLAGGKWKPAIHMKRSDSRLTLEIVNIRVQRLHDITKEDAIAEGIEEVENGWKRYSNCPDQFSGCRLWTSATASFMSLWQSINGADSWDANPWVFVVEFKKISAEVWT